MSDNTFSVYAFRAHRQEIHVMLVGTHCDPRRLLLVWPFLALLLGASSGCPPAPSACCWRWRLLSTALSGIYTGGCPDRFGAQAPDLLRHQPQPGFPSCCWASAASALSYGLAISGVSIGAPCSRSGCKALIGDRRGSPLAGAGAHCRYFLVYLGAALGRMIGLTLGVAAQPAPSWSPRWSPSRCGLLLWRPAAPPQLLKRPPRDPRRGSSKPHRAWPESIRLHPTVIAAACWPPVIYDTFDSTLVQYLTP
ncbi:hypothetical protein ACPA9J_14485 [Pseudomonas aeruginosa]